MAAPHPVRCRGDNLIFDARGRLRLVDFGVSRRTRGGAASIGTANGAPVMRAPELHRGPHAANTPATDMWSAGLVIYELCNARGASPYSYYQGARQRVDDWERRVKAGLSPESVMPIDDGSAHPALLRAMRACLHAEAAERPTAAQVFDDLVLGGKGGRHTCQCARASPFSCPLSDRTPAWLGA